MSQFEKAVKLSDDQFLRAVGVDQTAFYLIFERLAVYLEILQEERPVKKRVKKSELALTDRLLLTFTHLRHYPTFAGLGAEFGISESYANKIYHQILDVLVKVLSLKNRKHLLESNLQTIIIDVTEQPIERPTKGHRVYYTGKKNGTP
ncbi:MAG: transposase family protein [Candidatus Poribacteria bacterium]|nr:transposase family protein [Candidatus Poribacteria bacterium]